MKLATPQEGDKPAPTLRFVSVYDASHDERIRRFLFGLMQERLEEPGTNIRHRRMPSWPEHVKFINNNPYYVWEVIETCLNPPWTPEKNWALVGAVYITWNNEIGVHVSKHFRRLGIARLALRTLMASHKPKPAIPAKRVGHFLANINPANTASVQLFTGLGFSLAQLTYAHQETTHGKQHAAGITG